MDSIIEEIAEETRKVSRTEIIQASKYEQIGQKTPKFGNCAYSDKEGKRRANRRLRRKNRIEISKESEGFSILRDVSDVWNFLKDGKHFSKNSRTVKTKGDLLKYHLVKLIRKDRKW